MYQTKGFSSANTSDPAGFSEEVRFLDKTLPGDLIKAQSFYWTVPESYHLVMWPPSLSQSPGPCTQLPPEVDSSLEPTPRPKRCSCGTTGKGKPRTF